ncbi:type II secretion system protein [Sporosarcina sp. 179-K 3D1 HS]|uniref:type II secretion system protein n=1 Tax=Sporosarcina sp. 179-K 3D1 HS TaxID=3232169 RepID=UPI0039A2EFC6
MKNERGLTLVELLATLALIGVISALIIGVLINGMKASERSTTSQRLQQEANYITEVVRNEYLQSYYDYLDEIEFKVDGDALFMNEIRISEGFSYENLSIVDDTFSLTLSERDYSYVIETTFSKLN